MAPVLWDPHGSGLVPLGVLMLRLNGLFAEDATPKKHGIAGSVKEAKGAEGKATSVAFSSGNDADTEDNTGEKPSKKVRNGSVAGSVRSVHAKNGPAPEVTLPAVSENNDPNDPSNTSIYPTKTVLFSYGVLIPLCIPKQGTQAEYDRLKLESTKLLSYGGYIDKLVAGDRRWLPWLVKWGVLTKYKEIMMRDFRPLVVLDLDLTKQIAPLCVNPPEETWIIHLGMWLTKLEENDARLGLMLKKWGVVDDYNTMMLRFYTPEGEQQERKLVEARTTVALGEKLRELANENSQFIPLLEKWEVACNYKEAMKRHELEMSLALSEEQKKAKEMTDDEVAIANLDWPWTDLPAQLVLEAPLSLNRNRSDAFFKLPNMNDPEQNVIRGRKPGLFRILCCDNILQQVCEILFEHHSDVANFSLTCQSAFKFLSGTVQHWDLSRGDFLSSDLEPRLPDPTPREPQREKDNPQYKKPGKLLVASPFRLGKTNPDGSVNHDQWGMIPATTQLHNLQRMMFSMYKGWEHFEIIHLHRIPFLMFETLHHVVPFMRNLKVLGIYRCPLIHFGLILRLFRMMDKPRRIEVTRPPPRLDFSPRYHDGPKIQSGMKKSRHFSFEDAGNVKLSDDDVKELSEFYNGSYGVSWSNSEVDTRLAIWCYVQKAMVIAKRIGIEDCITSPSSALRQWMEKLCWNVGPILEALENDTYANDPEQLAALFDYPLTMGLKENLKYKFPYWGETRWCGTCKEQVLCIFFDYFQISQHIRKELTFEIISGPPLKCLGCKLAEHLANEEDHYQKFEKAVVREWTSLRRADGSVMQNKTRTDELFRPRKMKEARDKAEKDLDAIPEGARFGHSKYNERNHFPDMDFMQPKILPFEYVAPRTTDGKDHISNPPYKEPGVWSS